MGGLHVGEGLSNVNLGDAADRLQLDDHFVRNEEVQPMPTLDPKVMTGKPVVRGTRVTVEHILNLLAHGTSKDEILEEYDGLTEEDIQACLLFATKSLESTAFMPLPSETR